MNLYDLSHPSKKKKQQLIKESRLAEFAPPGGDDGGPDEDEILFKLAKQWWLGTESDMIRVERTLASMGWEIGEDEGSYDDGGVFVVRAGDVNGKSYQSWPHEELVTEGATVTTTPGSVEPGGAVDNFKQQMANNTEVAYQQKQQGMAEGDTVVKHRIGLTVTDPNHPMASKRNEPFQRTVRVPGDDPAKAINAAIAHYRRKGYKVHDHHYMGTVDYTIDEAAPDWLRRTAGAATGALAGVGASFPGAAIAGPIGGAVAGAYGAKAGYDLGADAADWVYDKVTGKKVPADKAEVDEELTMKHQRAHTTQRRPDISNSLADRDFDMSEKPNVAKSADGHPTVKWRHHGHAGHTRVEPTLNPTTVQRKDTRPIPSFLKKDVAETVDIGQEWMSDTELDQYVPERLQQQWRELLGYDRNGNPSALWANLTGGYEPDVNDPQHRALMVKVANKWFAAKKIPNVKFFDVKDADDELEWLVQIGQQGVAEAIPLDTLRSTAGTRVKDEVSAKLKQNGPLGRDAEKAKQNGKPAQQGVSENIGGVGAFAALQHAKNLNKQPQPTAPAKKQSYTPRHDDHEETMGSDDNYDDEMAEGGYQHGFADPNAPSLGGSGRKDDEGNSEFDDRQRRQTGMIFYKVDDAELAQQLGLKQTRSGKWYLRTGNRHAQQSADRAFGLGRIWYPESVEEAGIFGFMTHEPEKPVVKKPKLTLSQIRDLSKQEDEKTAKYVRSNDLPDNPDHMRVVHDDVELSELSNKLLGKYKRELGVRASAADQAGDYDAGHEYFKKINRATIRQGENDARRHAEKEKENDVMETRLNMMRKAGYDL